jgi:hypothetical protein
MIPFGKELYLWARVFTGILDECNVGRHFKPSTLIITNFLQIA